MKTKFKVGDKVKIDARGDAKVEYAYCRIGISKNTILTISGIIYSPNNNVIYLDYEHGQIGAYEKCLILLDKQQNHPLTKIFI